MMSSKSRLFRSAGLVCIGLLIGSYYNANDSNTSEVTGNNIRKAEQQQTLSAEDLTNTNKDSTYYDDEPISLLDIPPSTKQLIINVGTSIDPIMPPKSYGPCSHSIAIEPIVGHD